MSDESIPCEVGALLERIESYEQLEVLLRLHADPGRDWTEEEVSSELKISPGEALLALEHLCEIRLAGAVVQGTTRRFRYWARDPQTDGTVRALVRAYDEQRLVVVRLMNAHALERLRTAAIRTFADAFFVGGKKKDG